MATLAELQSRLTTLNAAIEKIEGGGQSYSADGRQMARADLATLYRERNRVETLVARASAGSGGGLSYGVPC